MTTHTTTSRRIKIRNPPPVLPCLPVMDSPPQGDKVVVITCQKPTYANYDEYLASDVWKKKRKEIIDRDGGRCRLCNSDKILHVHHRAYPKIYGEEPNEDLSTLCRKCHYIFHQNRSTHQIAKKTIFPKRRVNNAKKDKASPTLSYYSSVTRLNARIAQLLHIDGLLPSGQTIKFKEAVKIICLKTGQQFIARKDEQKRIARDYIENHDKWAKRH